MGGSGTVYPIASPFVENSNVGICMVLPAELEQGSLVLDLEQFFWRCPLDNGLTCLRWGERSRGEPQKKKAKVAWTAPRPKAVTSSTTAASCPYHCPMGSTTSTSRSSSRVDCKRQVAATAQCLSRRVSWWPPALPASLSTVTPSRCCSAAPCIGIVR